MLHVVPAPSPRQRRRETNFARILERAMQIVIEGGFDALSMHRLAADLDYTPGALYRYYRSKDVLISALTTRVLVALAEDVRRTAEAVPEDAPMGRAAAVVFAYRDLARRAPHRFGMLSMLAAEPRTLVPDPADAEPALAALMGAMSPLVQALRAAMDRGMIDEGSAADCALIAWGSAHGLLQLRKQENRGPALFDLDSLVHQSVRTLLVGWGAEPADVDQQMGLAQRAVTGSRPPLEDHA